MLVYSKSARSFCGVDNQGFIRCEHPQTRNRYTMEEMLSDVNHHRTLSQFKFDLTPAETGNSEKALSTTIRVKDKYCVLKHGYDQHQFLMFGAIKCDSDVPDKDFMVTQTNNKTDVQLQYTKEFWGSDIKGFCGVDKKTNVLECRRRCQWGWGCPFDGKSTRTELELYRETKTGLERVV